MDALSTTLGTFIGFSAVMLTASLLVFAIVRVWQYVSGRRSVTVAEMLGSLNHGYRLAHGDQAVAGDAAEHRFVLDILSEPVLHVPARLRKLQLPADPAPAARDERRRKLARQIEHLEPDVLVDLAAKHCVGGELPPDWYGALSPVDRSFEAFKAYIVRWFGVAEASSTEQYRVDTRQVVVVFSCLLVVLVNLDGFALVQSLLGSASVRNELADRAPDLRHSANAAGADHDPFAPSTDRDDHLDFSLSLPQLNAVLNEPDLGLGWTHSWITRKWCAYHGCAASSTGATTPSPDPVTGSDMFWSALRWLSGLAFSCAMVSLGAPFWAERLKSLLNLSNALQQRSASEPREP